MNRSELRTQIEIELGRLARAIEELRRIEDTLNSDPFIMDTGLSWIGRE